MLNLSFPGFSCERRISLIFLILLSRLAAFQSLDLAFRGAASENGKTADFQQKKETRIFTGFSKKIGRLKISALQENGLYLHYSSLIVLLTLTLNSYDTVHYPLAEEPAHG